ncbi:hypothetical protein HGRIS_009195 [Hohenbuehelia grisea]|uniref:Protein BIG1 n=1 Tax=Hohenbuehelia grisea TaxID=104357 RepID=A0ABR3J0U5_9AGAR
MAARIALIAAVAVCPLALAFSDNYPLVVWASHRSAALDVLPSTFAEAPSASLLEGLLSDERICEHDAILLVEQPGLRASDLRNLPAASQFVSQLSSSPSSKQYPYVRHHGALSSLKETAQTLSTRCRSRLVTTLVQAQKPIDAKNPEKRVLSVKLPELKAESAKERVKALQGHLDTTLADELNALSTSFPDYIVIYTGSPSNDAPSFVKRQVSAFDVHAAANTTLPEGGILKKYQLLTPGLITSLLVVFFVLLPALIVGISALASIQSPLRVEAPKGYNARDRKNQ